MSLLLRRGRVGVGQEVWPGLPWCRVSQAADSRFEWWGHNPAHHRRQLVEVGRGGSVRLRANGDGHNHQVGGTGGEGLPETLSSVAKVWA